ncbi:hypothetical protein H480_09518 [Amycolatopsis vancoresmycina DSM 44592]|uniref:Uncharacterized protein n=1 Tax=Amycolatopsis vancoresmycina DSM 44592 TaxID=1292037 RepID=R1HZ10_9PSEU|nr:hypothetical protein H480_09518 [Amycolatopsis vancoresmycina DSM 44592]
MALLLQVSHQVVLQLETGMVGSQIDTHGAESATRADLGHAPGVGIREQTGSDVRLGRGAEPATAAG